MKNYLKMSSACLLMALWPCAWAQHNPLGGFAYGDKEAPTGKEWESVEELALNKEYPRAYFFSFDNEAQAAQVRPEKSPYWLSLNGQWRFHWCKTPDERPKDFYKTNYDASGWDMTPVPSNWNVQGIQKDGKLKYGLPIYVNQPVIFYHERKVDDWRQGVMRTPPQTWTTYEYRNEVGSYIRYFEVPREWKGREVYIDFDGVDSFFYLWINGKYVGFSKNSRNAASFNISKYLKKGQNKLAVEVYRNSDGSFLESQDMFRLPGIFRTVALRSTPKVQIRNLNVLTDTDNLSDWQLKVTAEVRNLGKKEAKDYRLQYAVYKNILYKDDAQKVDALQATTEVQAVAPNAIEKVSAAIDVKQPDMWSAEAPNRYVLVAQLVDKKGKVIEAASTYFGFRKVEIRDTKAEDDSFGNAGRYFYVNGKPIKLKGVNRHETHPEQGHVVTHAQMEEEVMLMKRANINHVRCSHYPPDPYWFYLSDKYGIYLEDEANIESHEYYYGKESLSHPKEWEKAHTARVVEMVEAAYNSPSIVIWSLGNEAGPGQNFVTAYNHLKTLDTSRPVQYERNNDIVDMGSNQYPSVAWVKGAATGKYDIKYPFHISEYAHSMGNAVGNLADYWEAIESTNYICGGAIWDWVDQALTNYTPDGKPYAAYGGDFGDFPNDGQFVMNGIIFADRTAKPQYYEVQKVYQNIKVKKLSFDTFQITNKSYFEPMEGYEGVWKLYRNGELVEERSFDVSPLKPQKKGVVTIAPKRMGSKSEYIVVIEFRQAADKPWAKKGFVQAREQFVIQEAVQKPAIATVAEGNALELSPDQKMIVGKDFSVMFDFDKGTIETLKYGNNTIIENSGLALNAFRAFTNNDRWAYQQWFAKGLHNLQHKALAKSVKANADGSYSYSFTVQSQAPNAAKIEGGTASGRNKIVELTDRPFTDTDFRFVTNQVFTVYPDGSIEVQASIASNDDFVNLPQLGYLVTMPKTYFRFTYYGRGKQDNYSDRKTGAFLGIYESDVLKEAGNFPKPQDVGHHQDSRWAALTNMRGAGAIFVGTQPMDVAALPYTAQEMTLAGHPFELPNPSASYLQLNIATTGVGGNSCGPTPLQRDRVMATQHRFGFIIRPAQAKLAEAANVSASTEAPAFVAGLINRSTIPMKVIFASSEEVGAGNATHLVDGNPNTIWHSAYSVTVAKHPHWVDFDLSKEVSFKGISYLPRTDEAGNGDVKDFSISISDDAKTWKEVHKGSFSYNRGTAQQVLFKAPVKARYVRFTALSEQYGQDFASGAEFGLIAE
ncbi:glycoside hydrolase family 2 TIM barrel-domain containing protein [Capnocytophaga leadbetteri]|uniref:glycoside hydrolase family 2 TIM barrel-domain containing protein n=1 Tax=Capnocytophaga leadbetteri TaxID=327575 RepID=UPI0028D41A3C|nr:glycoside hydrolase family 2 TIM barrel-domain containing protein [Capnocytophaga leadbetteri]